MSFKKGQSGNKAGRPIGALNKRTVALRTLIEGESEALVRKAVEMAKEGDIQALKLCLERILPPIKDDVLTLGLRIGTTTASLFTASGQVIKAVAQGEITPAQGETLINMIERYGKMLDLKLLESRIIALEEVSAKQ